MPTLLREYDNEKEWSSILKRVYILVGGDGTSDGGGVAGGGGYAAGGGGYAAGGGGYAAGGGGYAAGTGAATGRGE
jgi:hypothetical protein